VERWLRYRWPGNVRELSNGCAFAVGVAGARARWGAEHWPDAPFAEAVAEGRTSTPRRARWRSAVARDAPPHARQQDAAARALGLSRQGLLKKLRRYGLGPDAADAFDD
jgi:two-component system NtrC family response regulator